MGLPAHVATAAVAGLVDDSKETMRFARYARHTGRKPVPLQCVGITNSLARTTVYIEGSRYRRPL